MKILKKSLLGLLIVFSLSLTALSAEAQVGGVLDNNGNAALCFGAACPQGGGGGGAGFSLGDDFGLPAGSIFGIILNLLYWLLGLLGVFGIIAFLISGILYLTSAGDEGQIDRAKTAMLWSIVGVLVGLSGFVIIQAVEGFLNGAAEF